MSSSRVFFFKLSDIVFVRKYLNLLNKKNIKKKLKCFLLKLDDAITDSPTKINTLWILS